MAGHLVRVAAEDAVADHLVAEEGDDAQVGRAVGPVEIADAPVLERADAVLLVAGDVAHGVDRDLVHAALDGLAGHVARDEPDALGQLHGGRAVQLAEVELDLALALDLAESAVGEERQRVRAVLLGLDEQLAIALAEPAAELAVERVPHAGAARLGDDEDAGLDPLGLGVAGHGIGEGRADVVVALAGDQVDADRHGRAEVAQPVDVRGVAGVGAVDDVDARCEVRFVEDLADGQGARGHGQSPCWDARAGRLRPVARPGERASW